MIMKYSLRTIMLGFSLLSGMISSTTAECVDKNGFILKNDEPRNCVDYVQRCNNPIVAQNCPVTCGTCPTTTEAPVAAITGEPTEAPVAVTTGAPVAVTTEAPTAATTGAPVAVTTEAPVAATTGAPTAATTTGAPTAATTGTPTAATTGAPTAATTGAPVAVTTEAPAAVTTPKNGWSSPPILSVDSLTYIAGDEISVTFDYGPGNELDWVGIFEAATATEDLNITTVKDWLYVDDSARSGTIAFNSTGLENGEYKAYLFGNNTYTPVAESSVFTLSEETGGVPEDISSSSVIAPSALVMSMMVGVVATLFA